MPDTGTQDIAAKKARLREIITAKSLSKGGDFKLASGGASTFYFDMKPTMLDPEGANLMADLILDVLKDQDVDAVSGLALGAIPVVTAVVQKSFQIGRPIPGFYVRKDQKERGMEKLIDGVVPEGGKVVVFEDVTTKGNSALKAVEAIKAAGCTVVGVITLVDRLDGAEDNLKSHGLNLTAILRMDEFEG